MTPVRRDRQKGVLFGASMGAAWNHPDTHFLITAFNVFGKTAAGGIVLDKKYTDYPKDSTTVKPDLVNVPPEDLDRKNYFTPQGPEIKKQLEANCLELVKEQIEKEERWRIIRTTTPASAT